MRLLDLALLAGGVFAVNLLPAFGPPTWAVLVFARLHASIAAVPLVLVGALAAASGRMVLAMASGRLKDRFSAPRREGLEALGDFAERRRGSAILGLGLFALSPVPSAQLFMAAGILGVRLIPLTAAFFAGRLVSYSIYVAGASAAREKLSTLLADGFASPLGIALQIAMLGGLVALLRIDWMKRLHAPSHAKKDGEPQQDERTDRRSEDRSAEAAPAVGLGPELYHDQRDHRTGREPERRG
jgi:cytochrome c biogenesis protein CcdA